MSSTSRIAISSIATEDFSTWNIDPAHSAAEFEVRHMMISNVKGRFSGLSGVLKLDDTDYAHSTVEVSIPAASVRTVDEKFDAHLKGEDFFDVEKFPALTFRSTSIRYTGSHDYAVAGDLTIRGVTKSVTLTVNDVSEPSKDPWGQRAHRSFRLNRTVDDACGKWVQADRGARPSQAVFLAGDRKADFLASEPKDDAQFVPVFAHSLEHAGGYSSDEAMRVARTLLTRHPLLRSPSAGCFPAQWPRTHRRRD